MSLEDKYSIVPSTGVFGEDWPSSHNLTQGASGSLSTAGWTTDSPPNLFGNEGFIQQTFLGASVRSFELSAGFGDTTSSLNVQLVNDEFNKSDEQGLGAGDDPYHDGEKDEFKPPVVGSPVFFKFGKNFATVEQAFRQTFDDLYGIKTLPDRDDPTNSWGYKFPTSNYNPEDFPDLPDYHFVNLEENLIQDRSELWNPDAAWRGRNHFVFGGILQSYTQNKSQAGMPVYSATINDPREILSSVDVLFNNYQGTTFNYKNLINVYGFLEYDPSQALLSTLSGQSRAAGIVGKLVANDGSFDYFGLSSSWSPSNGWNTNTPKIAIPNLYDEYELSLGGKFPITGQGFSRRSDKGIPWYRVSQALTAIFEYNGPLPQEYKDAGFGGRINFRGYNYVVDFSGIPTQRIPLLYYLDFDKLDLLSLAQELCDILSHELYVTLLPVIDHPACKYLHDFNNSEIEAGRPQNIVAGIIRLDAIDKTTQPRYGAIKSYLDQLESRGINVENQDVGFELSNVTTDKFVVGGQEIDMYIFSTERDRDDLWVRENNVGNIETLKQTQWNLETQEQQQVLPYYGKIGNNAVSIPRGFGAYQQILIDATELNAFGVGNYYIATELELRAASVSYESWKDFLLSYNDIYLEDISDHSIFFSALSAENNQVARSLEPVIEELEKIANETSTDLEPLIEYLNAIPDRKFAVTVPRCVWDSDKPYLVDGYPASPCSPPFGYPLYYRRATRIGIIEAGMGKLLNAKTRVISDLADLERQHQGIRNVSVTTEKLINANKDDKSKDRLDKVAEKALDELAKTDVLIGVVKEDSNKKFLYNLENTAKRHEQNAKKVYEFIRKIADECLGKKFLVRIPKKSNLSYTSNISTFSSVNNFNIRSGPFGFPPRPTNVNIGPPIDDFAESDLFNSYLDDSKFGYRDGSLKGNYNPFSEKWEWNYKPEPQGGFHAYSLIGSSSAVVNNGLFPIDNKKLETSSNRVGCYVKYNNSHLIDFTGIGSDNVIQQTINQNGQFVPDIIDSLPNNNLDAEASFDMIQQVNNSQSLAEIRPNSVAFVKCDVDENLYMPPKLQTKDVRTWASDIEYVFTTPNVKVRQVRDDNNCVREEPYYERSTVLFRPSRNPGPWTTWTDFARYWDNNLKSWIIDSSIQNLDSEHVYALITLPGRIKSTADVRWKDGPGQSYEGMQKKHLMCQDVVYIPQFNQPRMPDGNRNFQLPIGPIPEFGTPSEASLEAEKYGLTKSTEIEKANGVWVHIPGKPEDWNNISLEQISSARDIEKQIRKSFSLSQPASILGYTSPSPVFPDFVAIPMMSMERCYGPWLSASQLDTSQDARIKYSNIGGRVEFIKDENLTPWNYAGYQLLNEAGSLQAQFSNSLLLFSERGGFVIPDAPTGIALASALNNGGPLVTSLSISVDGSNGVKTTVKLDLYTSKFGKLQKQKEMAISQIARERQKLLDNTNNAIRKGLGKSQTSADLTRTVMANGGNMLTKLSSELSAQVEANKNLGKELSQTFLALSEEGGNTMPEADLNRVLSNLDGNLVRPEQNRTLIRPIGEVITPISVARNFRKP